MLIGNTFAPTKKCRLSIYQLHTFTRQWKGFDAYLRPIIVGVLTRFKPYKDFIAEVNKRGGISGDLAFYLSATSQAQKQQLEEWGQAETTKKIDEPLETIAG